MRIAKYFFIGGVAAAIDISIFFVFAKLAGLNYLAVGAVGFVVATFVNYGLSIRYVFKSGVRFTKGKEVFFVYAISAGGLAINQLLLFAAIDLMNIEMMLSKLFATTAVFFWNYYIRSHFVFSAKKVETQATGVCRPAGLASLARGRRGPSGRPGSS